MYRFHCLNPISQVGLETFTEEYVPVSEPEKADAILVRSTNMKEMEFAKELKAIARAGAGVNNIHLEKCAEEGIVVFNTPGANANGVKELVLAGMLLASRDIIGGINWVQENEEDGNIAKDAEKAKEAWSDRAWRYRRAGGKCSDASWNGSLWIRSIHLCRFRMEIVTQYPSCKDSG